MRASLRLAGVVGIALSALVANGCSSSPQPGSSGSTGNQAGTSITIRGCTPQNPLIATRGHIAIILPNFARPRIRRWSVGVYVYEGDHEWQALGGCGNRYLVLENDHE